MMEIHQTKRKARPADATPIKAFVNISVVGRHIAENATKNANILFETLAEFEMGVINARTPR